MQDFRKKILENIKQDDLKNSVPSVSFEVGKFLSFMIHHKKPQKVLEIGTAHAYSTIWMGSAVEKIGGKLTTVDRSELSLSFAKQNIEKAKLEKTIQIIFKNGLDALVDFKTENKNFDLIFIDAQKSLTKQFFQLSEPILNKNGLIIVDDVAKFKEKMSDFWDYLKKSKSWEFVILPLDADDSIVMIQRI